MIRVLIADDHTIIRKGLTQILLEEFPDAIIKEVADGAELLKQARAGKWDIIISDLSMPGKTGLESLKQIREENPKQSVLILSMHPEDQYAIRVLRAGAAGYLNKEGAPEELIKAVRQILSGRRYISPAVAEKLAEDLNQDSTKALHESLSDREFHVLKLISSGKTVSEIADILALSVATVSTYRARILLKMNMKTNAELTHYAIENKLA